MKNIWKTVGVVALVIIILGAICSGIGLFTGADLSRIYTVIDLKFGISEIIKTYQTNIETVIGNISSVF